MAKSIFVYKIYFARTIFPWKMFLQQLAKIWKPWCKQTIPAAGGVIGPACWGPASLIRPTPKKNISCLGPVEPYALSAHISELIVLAHIGKKLRARQALYAQLRKTPIA